MTGCGNSPSKSIQTTEALPLEVKEIEDQSVVSCDLPTTIALDNETLISLGMPDLDGGSQMEFILGADNNVQKASSLISLSTGPNFVSYTFEKGVMKRAHFVADAYTPIFDEAGEFVEIDYEKLIPLQDTVFTFNSDGTETVLRNLEPNMEELLLILNPPLDPYNEWFEHHWESTYEFLDLWKIDFCSNQ